MNGYLFLLPATVLAFSCRQPQPVAEVPLAPRIDTILEMHGHQRVDPYYWMNDRENPAVINYLEAENAYLQARLVHTTKLQEELFEEMKGRIKQDEESAPFFRNAYYYYVRYETGAEYPIYCRKQGSLEAAEEVMLNVNELAESQPYFNVGGYDVSPDNRLLAFTVDTIGRRQYTIKLKDLETGMITATGTQFAGGDVSWASDNETVFFTSIDPVTLRYNRINRYNINGGKAPEEVYYEEDETFYYIGVNRSKDNRYLMITAYSTLSNETWLLEAGNPTGKFRVFQPREKNLLYDVWPHHGRFFVRTNWNAQNFRLMETPANATHKKNWKEVVPHRPDVLFENMEVFDDYLVLQGRKQGLNRLRIMHLSSGDVHNLEFPEEAYTASIGINAEMSTDVVRFNYTSPTTPNSTYDYNMATRRRDLIKRQEIPGGFDPELYETRRLYATARDGVQVPLTLLYRKNTPQNGQNALLLYAYGSYGSSINPRFNANIFSLVDRGFVYALAHVRGGQELGRQWYEDGKLLKKWNTFNDFIDCAEFLVAEKYTNPGLLFAGGGSAGGLLMGVIINERPELFRGVIASVPFVDVVTTMLDETIPLTTAEYDEWGNPNNREYYDYMLSYSPYDNVVNQAYPNLLVTSGLHDSQVQYWEPTKWVAKLRKHNTGDGIILLHTNMKAGHGGASGRFRRLRETALEYAFLLDLAFDSTPFSE
ncbi:MAG TPA: S9 family peptidase [Bacteroidales bacterium]|nr:S9 family peptidase [Bacteroidales bacterium]